MFHFIHAAAHYKFAGLFAFLFVLFLCQPLYGGIIEHTIQTGPYEILQGPDGQVIRAVNFGSLGVSGKPKLPYKIFAFALPPGTEMTALHVEGGKAVTLEGAYHIAPAQAPRFIGPENADLTEQNQATWQSHYDAVYTSNEPFPTQVGRFVRKAGFRKYNLVDVEIMPFIYQPASGILKYHEAVTVKIEYSPRVSGESDLFQDYSPRMEKFASQFIYNYEEAQAWYPRPHDNSSREVNDFVIITTPALSSAVTTLANWESAKGRNVEVVTTDWIYANYTGDDNAEEIRNFLLDKYPTAEWGIEDVLVVGHHNDVPMREVYQDLGYGRPRTDYYYAELSSPDATSWDSNNNNHYGENSDNMNFYPEVHVGRIPWSSALIVQNICQKSMAYEQNNDITFKKNILLLGAYFWSDTDNAVMMEAKVDQPWMADWTMTRMYEKNSSYYSTYPCDYELLHSNVMAVWPSGKYAFVNYAGHGSPTSCHIYGLGAPAFIQGSDCSSLNDNYPAIVFADACSNSDTDYTNIGMSMLEQGAVGFVGATQVALGCPGWNDPADGSSQSLDYYFTTCVTSGTYTQGAALQYGLVQNYQQGGWDDNCYEICQWGALWGNPDLVLGGDFPDMPNIHYMAHTVDDSAGNGDGFVDAGETITMAVTMENAGSAEATAVSATISTDTPGVTINDDTATYPDIPVDENRVSDIPHFNFSVDGTVQVGTYIEFDLDITTAEADFSTSFTQVVGQIEPIFFDDLESGEGDWTHGGNFDDWTLGDPAGSGSASDPGGAYSPSHVWGTDLGADGNYENFCNQWLGSPVVDCSQYTGTLLRYYRYLNIQKGQYDHARIYVNGNVVWENDYGDDTADSSWTYHEVDISEYADGHPYVMIRWELAANGSVSHGGWNIDDVELAGFHIGGNNHPDLTGPSVTPESGYYGTRFEYRVHYYDEEGEAPSLISVVIDGLGYDMTLDSGSPADGTYQYRTRDISQGETHNYYFSAADSAGKSARHPAFGTFSGPETEDPLLVLSGTAAPGATMTIEVWGCADALWGAAWSKENGPFYLPASGLTYDIGPGNLKLVKKIGEDPLHLDAFGYGTKDFDLPAQVSSGTKYIQGTTKMNAYWAKSNFETFVMP